MYLHLLTVVFLMQMGMLLAYIYSKGVLLTQFVVPQDTKVVLSKATFQLVSPQHVLVHEIFLTQV